MEIAAIARGAGHRTKIAVRSTVAGVNAKGACIGHRGLVNLLTSEILDDSPSGDEIDATITNTWQYGASGELLGASYRGVTSGAIDLAQDTTTTVTNVVIPDGVLLLAQRYLEGFNGVVPNYPGAPGYAVNAAYTDGFGKIRRQPVAGKLLVSF